MNRIALFKTDEEDTGIRLDVYLTSRLDGISRSAVQKIISDGLVTIDGAICLSRKTQLSPGHTVKISIPEEKGMSAPLPEKIPLKIIFEDEFLLVIDKPPGMVVHPAAGSESGTVVNALLAAYPGFENSFTDKTRPGIVHRLDKDTSGCLLIAKKQRILEKLSASFKKHRVTKTYTAIVCGHFRQPTGTISADIGRHPVNRKKMAVIEEGEGGKSAVTHYKVIKELHISGTPASLLEIQIETGRTHQIRVHMNYLHHPVAGDTIYGGNRKIPATRQLLHASELIFPHPKTGEIITCEAVLPNDFQKYLMH